MRNRLDIYPQSAARWWSANSPFRSLAQITPFRLALITEWIPDISSRTVLDLGCGGGFLSVPLSRAAARVVALDLSRECAAVARAECAARGSPIHALAADALSLPFRNRTFDLVIAADVLEHVPNLKRTLEEIDRVLRPNGLVYVSTISATLAAKLLVVHLAEAARIIPPGTHDPRLFITPQNLLDVTQPLGWLRQHLCGEAPRLLPLLHNQLSLRRSPSTSIAYSSLFTKPHPQSRTPNNCR